MKERTYSLAVHHCMALDIDDAVFDRGSLLCSLDFHIELIRLAQDESALTMIEANIAVISVSNKTLISQLPYDIAQVIKIEMQYRRAYLKFKVFIDAVIAACHKANEILFREDTRM